MNINYSELDDSTINMNYTPDLNMNYTSDLNMNYTPDLNTNYTPDLNTNYNPDLNTNYTKKININTPDIKNNFASTNEVNYEKYWENSNNQPNIQTKKKKVSFDDILSNMNIVVNNQGVLQFMQPTQSLQEQIYNQPPQYQEQQHVQNQNYQNQQYQQPYQEYVAQQVAKKQPLDPSIKNSFLYNKYFKDYRDVSVQPEIRVPKTIEEYKQMLLEDKLKRIEQKKRAAEIKSTKLLFTTSTGNQDVIKSTKHNLRGMTFHT
jgi:hypothetical protein